MVLNRKKNLDKITELLAYLKSQVEISNPNNFTDINIHSENFYRDFLNLIFEYDLKNINIDDQNAAAIDLGDKANKFAIQVTATSALDKVRSTVSKFVDHNLDPSLRIRKCIIMLIV